MTQKNEQGKSSPPPADEFFAFDIDPNIYRREVTSLAPLSQKVSAVFIDPTGTPYRVPQLAIASYDQVRADRRNGKELSREKGHVGFINSADAWNGGTFADEQNDFDSWRFLGFELDGEEQDWSTEITSRLQERDETERGHKIRAIAYRLKNSPAEKLLWEAEGAVVGDTIFIRSHDGDVLEALEADPALCSEIQRQAGRVFGKTIDRIVLDYGAARLDPTAEER